MTENSLPISSELHLWPNILFSIINTIYDGKCFLLLLFMIENILFFLQNYHLWLETFFTITWATIYDCKHFVLYHLNYNFWLEMLFLYHLCYHLWQETFFLDDLSYSLWLKTFCALSSQLSFVTIYVSLSTEL